MCAQFLIKSSIQKIIASLGQNPRKVEVHGFELQDTFDLRVQGFLKSEMAPVIRGAFNKDLEILPMKFSLCPSWSKEFPAPFTTYNARMERVNKGRIEKIYQIPSWRESFQLGRTCLVPMTAAIESSYFGLSAGNIVRFMRHDREIFFAAGIWSSWTNPSTGEIHETFALITDDPYEFFFEHGHDRSIISLRPEAYDNWLLSPEMKSEERFQFIRKNRITLPWAVETDRSMKAGWEKRAPSLAEISEIKIWKP